MTISKPAIRSLIVPDPGYTIIDADLGGADAQVVAAEAEDEMLLTAFRQGLDVHSMNAEMVFGPRWSAAKGTAKSGERGHLRQQTKQAVHATNYGAHARTVASTLGWTTHEAETFQRKWFALHPGIRNWHTRVAADLRASRTASNRFGYRIIYFDRIDALLPEALAWIPQSTVALTTFYGAKRVDEALNNGPAGEQVEWLLQVHDSLVFQIRTPEVPRLLPQVASLLRVPIPYPSPLTIPWKIALSTQSWHDCKEWAEPRKAA